MQSCQFDDLVIAKAANRPTLGRVLPTGPCNTDTMLATQVYRRLIARARAQRCSAAPDCQET
jgi:hypothetical protein